MVLVRKLVQVVTKGGPDLFYGPLPARGINDFVAVGNLLGA